LAWSWYPSDSEMANSPTAKPLTISHKQDKFAWTETNYCNQLLDSKTYTQPRFSRAWSSYRLISLKLKLTCLHLSIFDDIQKDSSPFIIHLHLKTAQHKFFF
jgi:hypothetical protein